MNAVLIGNIPEIIRLSFNDVSIPDTNISKFTSADDLFASSISNDFEFIVFEYNDQIEAIVKKAFLIYPKAKIIVFNSPGTEMTTKLMRLGVDYCYSSKINRENLTDYLRHALMEINVLVNQKIHKYRWFVGGSAVIQVLKQKMGEAVSNAKNLVICGQHGTGKINIARIIHESKCKSNDQFKIINLNSYSQDYLQSQFWQMLKNCFSEIESDIDGLKVPLYRTIYIEGLEAQQKEFVETILQYVNRIIADFNSKSSSSAPRIVFAWNTHGAQYQGLEKMFKDYFIIEVPSLIMRKEDIPMLVHTMIKKYAIKHNIHIRNISLDALDVLMNYSWPGNIKELQSVIEYAVLNSRQNDISSANIGVTLNMLHEACNKDVLGVYIPLSDSISLFQKVLIETIVKCSSYSNEKIAKLLGLKKSELFNKMNVLGINLN